jgi:hypothetical protein
MYPEVLAWGLKIGYMRAWLLSSLLMAITTAACRHEFTTRLPVSPEGTGPRIVSFTATPRTVSAGDPVTLSWIVRGSNLVVLEEARDAAIGSDAGRLQEIARFSDSGSLEVRPRETMVYVLTCPETSGSACMSLSVRVTVSSGH